MGSERAWLRVLLVAGALASLVVLAPWLGVIVLAGWFGRLARPATRALEPLLGGRRRAAAVVTTLACVLIVAPLVLLLGVSIGTARALLREAHEQAFAGRLLDEVGRASKDGAVAAAQAIGRGATHAALGAALFAVGAYTCLAEGERAWAWLGAQTPLHADARARLAGAFHECGRGLLVGMLLTALLQGFVATAVYAAVRAPHPIVLGGLTLLGAFVPLIGTASVWGPVAVGLYLSGRPLAALCLASLGLAVVGTIDNLMRPYLTRFGRLELPTWVVASSMFGGLSLLGVQGLWLGPLVVRLTVELLALAPADER